MPISVYAMYISRYPMPISIYVMYISRYPMPISVSVIVGMFILMSYSTRQDERKIFFFFNGVFPLVYLIFFSMLQNSIILCSNVNWFIIFQPLTMSHLPI
jgi:hypothetical protein